MADENHEHGFPHWLFQHDIQLVIVGNIGDGALNKLKSINVDVIAGAKSKRTRELVEDYLKGELQFTNVECNHMGCKS